MNNLTKNVILTPFNILYRLSPAAALKLMFRLKHGFRLDLDNPRTFTEKLQWIKLNDKNPLMPECCDKYAVRAFVEKQGCGELLNHLIWEGFDPEEIPFDDLPDRFVLKITHGSTFNIICRDKEQLNRDEVIKKCRRWLREQYLICYGEWFYGKVRPRIIIEDYLEDKSSGKPDLIDYKVFCFNGRPDYIRVMSERTSGLQEAMYDTRWNLLEGKSMGYPLSNERIECPECLDQMMEAARRLSSPFLHARVDFYVVNGKLYFGEITFTSGAGFHKFGSYEFDLEVGSRLNLTN